MTRRSDFRHLERLRVRWAEVDLQKIVFNGHYLTYFDTAIAGYWRAMALPYEASLRSLDGDLFVRSARVDYLAPARYDDLLEVGIRKERIGNSSIVFSAAVFHGERPLVEGELVYVFADPATRTPRPVPQALRDTLDAFEAGAAMVEVQVGDWQALGAQAQALRTQVFVEEQGIPAAMEWDSADATAVHAVASNRLGMTLGTGRMLVALPGVAKIGRMAVTQPARGSRVGALVLEALMQAARERGDHEVLLHAQMSAAGFYLRNGFAERGERFEEAGIQHVEMVRRL